MTRTTKVIIALAVAASFLALIVLGITGYKLTHPRVWTVPKVEDVVSRAPGLGPASCSPVSVAGNGAGTYSCSSVYTGPASYDAPVLIHLTIVARGDGSWTVQN